MSFKGISFSVASDAAWAPGVETREAWQVWATQNYAFSEGVEPAVRAMPAMLRRRIGFLGKMALEVAYRCLDGRSNIPTVFCSRHGEVSRSVDLLSDLARGELLSPTAFGMSVHNATGGLFSIARADQANNSALSAGKSTIEYAVIEACSLLAEGEPAVLLVAYDCPLPDIYAKYQDQEEQPYAWAWLMQPPSENVITLEWESVIDTENDEKKNHSSLDKSAGLEVLQFYLRNETEMRRACGVRRWKWTRHA